MTYDNVEPRSLDWFRLRCGKVTSTRLGTVAHGTLAAQTKLLDLMEAEAADPEAFAKQYFEESQERAPSSIRLGREREDWLRARYEILLLQQHGTPPVVEQPGFIEHPHVKHFADSPDWHLIAPQRRAGEGKVRVDETKHAYAIKRGVLPEDKPQCYAHMMCGGFDQCDYVSYCPTWEDAATQVHIVTIQYEREYGDFLYAELRRFVEHFERGTRPTGSPGLSGIPSFE